ncbi:MAG: Eco57I restriction-modification methylase domain-containing protein [Gammaproteobacteria bacterium AqS3]|nr:Eco57I restriction-modification methylase domain-containing protein [Gammaproteobacteria bacterium AqS3]
MNNLNYNPDVLSCLANLSSDEVFTPPSIANQVLDLFPDELWSDKTATFLDPGTKSGIFLREIAKRLLKGLEQEIPDLQERVNHIMTQQLFGMGITELTSLLARRSVYCSKHANGKFSICDEFEDQIGNIFFNPVKHTWRDGKCIYCGASEQYYSREQALETHAYQFIHGQLPERIKAMKFDVIIGNPPYHMSDGGGGGIKGPGARPIYQKFVQQSKKLNPRFIAMIIPSRWLGGGRSLAEFRAEMLSDRQIRKLVDFENASECFPGVDIAGGICYFLWEKDSDGDCEVENVFNGRTIASKRSLNEFDIFIRHGKAIDIIRKVLKPDLPTMNEQVSSRQPFGLNSQERPKASGDLTLRWKDGEGPFPSAKVATGIEMIDKWKVITAYVGNDHGGNPDKDGKRRVLSKVEILPPGTICNETYLVAGSFAKKKEALNLQKYMKTKFFRFLVSQFMYSHHLTRQAYSFVPILPMNEIWTDQKLGKFFKLSDDDIAFIDSKIRAME